MTSAQHAPEPPNDLLRRFHQGEARAIEELANSFFADVQRFCRALLADEDAAMDAVQETFLRLLERHRTYRPARAFRPWLFAIARNVCISLRRAQSAQAARVVDLEPTDAEIERLAATVHPALERLLRECDEARALASLAALPEEPRTIVTLHLFEDLTFREVADIVARPPNTVATIYYRALDQLRRTLDTPEHLETAPRSRHHAS